MKTLFLLHSLILASLLALCITTFPRTATSPHPLAAQTHRPAIVCQP